jgi:hypothetical protein
VRAERLCWFPHLAFPSAKYRQAAQLQQQRYDAEGREYAKHRVGADGTKPSGSWEAPATSSSPVFRPFGQLDWTGVVVQS